jgi:hypothetical protein
MIDRYRVKAEVAHLLRRIGLEDPGLQGLRV